MRRPSRDLIAELLALKPKRRNKVIDSLTADEALAVLHSWRVWARPEQLYDPEPDEVGRLIKAGRGWGKTRTGAEATLEVAQDPERCGGRIVLVGRTAGDLRRDMLYGEGGIMNVAPPWFRPVHNPSKMLLTFPNGVVAHTISADKPQQARGLNFGFASLDELAHWAKPEEAFDQIQFGLRIGTDPRWLATTTPLPTKFIRDLVKEPGVEVVGGRSYDNLRNLSRKFIDKIIRRYEGTRLGRQELEGLILDDNPNSLWSWDMFRRIELEKLPGLTRIVVAIDPAVTNKPTSSLTGIIVAGIARNRVCYVLHDASGRYSARGWAEKALELYAAYKADRIVGERNNGGDLVERNVRTCKVTVDGKKIDGATVPYSEVWASRGKVKRAEPVSSYYEQGKVFHVGDPRRFVDLEDQLTTYDPTLPPESQEADRMDADVWAITELTGGDDPRARIKKLKSRTALEALRKRLGRAA